MNAVFVAPQPKICHTAHVDRLPSIVADGVYSCSVYGQKVNSLTAHGHRPTVEVRADWYY